AVRRSSRTAVRCASMRCLPVPVGPPRRLGIVSVQLGKQRIDGWRWTVRGAPGTRQAGAARPPVRAPPDRNTSTRRNGWPRANPLRHVAVEVARRRRRPRRHDFEDGGGRVLHTTGGWQARRRTGTAENFGGAPPRRTLGGWD